MYLISDKRKRINSIKKMLGLRQNGKYDEEIAKALSDYGAKTERIDYPTYKKILSEYKEKQKKEYLLNNAPFFAQNPFSFGDSGSSIIILNAYLYDLIKYYRLFWLRSPLGSVYSKRTEDAVGELRDIFLLNKEGGCDTEFLYRLFKEHKSIYLR